MPIVYVVSLNSFPMPYASADCRTRRGGGLPLFLLAVLKKIVAE